MKALRREHRKIADLVPAPYNPRTIDEKSLNALMDSISRFGQVQDVIVNVRTGFTVGGHQRALAMQKLGHKECWVTFVDLEPVAEKALNVALNSPHLAGSFTDDLAGLLTEIRGLDPDAFAELRFDALMPKAKDEDPEPAVNAKPEALRFLVTELQRLTIDQALEMMRDQIEKPARGRKGEQLRNGIILERLCVAYIESEANA